MERRGTRPRYRFLREADGAIAVWFALSLPIFIGLAALAIDISFQMVMRNKMQVTASASALAGAALLPEVGPALAEAQAFSEKNAPAGTYGVVLKPEDIKIGNWDDASRIFTDGTRPFNAVSVTTRLAETNDNAMGVFFAGIVGMKSLSVNTEAIAVSSGPLQNACIMALEPVETGFYMNGNNTLTASQCGVCVNSSDSQALHLDGTPSIVAVDADVHVHGLADIGPNASVTPMPLENQTVCTDPFLANPLYEAEFADTNCTGSTTKIGNRLTIHAGTHCSTIKVTGSTKDVLLEPGIHHFKDSDFEIAGQADVVGSGVTLLLTNAMLKLDGAKSLDLSAPADTEIAIYQNPATPADTHTHDIGGNVSDSIDGIQYYGMQNVKYHGTPGVDGGGDCNVLIARFIDFRGTVDSDFEASCGLGQSNVPTIGVNLPLRLVN